MAKTRSRVKTLAKFITFYFSSLKTSNPPYIQLYLEALLFSSTEPLKTTNRLASSAVTDWACTGETNAFKCQCLKVMQLRHFLSFEVWHQLCFCRRSACLSQSCNLVNLNSSMTEKEFRVLWRNTGSFWYWKKFCISHLTVLLYFLSSKYKLETKVSKSIKVNPISFKCIGKNKISLRLVIPIYPSSPNRRKRSPVYS